MRPEHIGNTITSTTHRYGQSTYYKRTNQSSESLVVAAQVQFIQVQGSQILSVYLGFFPFRLAWLMASPCVTQFFSKLLLFSKYLNPWTGPFSTVLKRWMLDSWKVWRSSKREQRGTPHSKCCLLSKCKAPIPSATCVCTWTIHF